MPNDDAYIDGDRQPHSEAESCAAPPRKLTRAEASRINGAKSRGPKTEGGKRRSSQNAVTHGITCHPGTTAAGNTEDSVATENGRSAPPFLLSNEDPEVYEKIRDICISGLRPEDEFEWELVGEIAITRFLARRIYATEARVFDRAMLEDAEHFGREQELYGAAEDERLAAALEHAPGVHRVATLMRRYDTQISRKFHHLLGQLRHYRVDKRRRGEDRDDGPDGDNLTPGGTGPGLPPVALPPALQHTTAPAPPSAQDGQEHAGIDPASPHTPSLAVVSWSSSTFTGVREAFGTRQSRAGRTSSEQPKIECSSRQSPNTLSLAATAAFACSHGSLAAVFPTTVQSTGEPAGTVIQNEPENPRPGNGSVPQEPLGGMQRPVSREKNNTPDMLIGAVSAVMAGNHESNFTAHHTGGHPVLPRRPLEPVSNARGLPVARPLLRERSQVPGLARDSP